MPDKSKTKADIYLEKLKNNPIIAIIIVAGIALVAIAGLTDSLSKITTFVSGFVTNGSSLSIEYLIENTTNDDVEIERFSDFYLIDKTDKSHTLSVWKDDNLS